MVFRTVAVAGLLALAGCSSTDGTETGSAALASPQAVTVTPVSASASVPSPPAAGSYRLQMIDVGTGLSVLVQGADFTMLYDAGSNDDDKAVGDSPNGNQNPLLAYLYAAVGPSGGPECVPQGDAWKYNPVQGRKTIDHLVLSHAHEDHISMMSDVLHCYDVTNVWEPGADYPSPEYQAFSAAVREAKVSYHTAAKVAGASRSRRTMWSRSVKGHSSRCCTPTGLCTPVTSTKTPPCCVSPSAPTRCS